MDESFSPTIFPYGIALAWAMREKGVHADDLADPPKIQTRGEAEDAADMEGSQTPETGCSEFSPASRERADSGRSLEYC
jgi:hypothetical protein